MLYRFTDIDKMPSRMLRPSEDVAVDGEWLTGWNGIPLRVLYTIGRHGLSTQVNSSGKIMGRDGEIVYASSLPTRKISIMCVMKSKDSSRMVESFTELRAFLYRGTEMREFCFADDAEYRYFGRCISISEPQPGKNTVKFEITISCPDPYRYSEERTRSVQKMLDEIEPKGFAYKLIRYVVTPNGAELIKNITTQERIALNSTISSEVTVDFEKSAIFDGNKNITDKLAFESSQFPEFLIHYGDEVKATGVMTYRVRMP